MNTTIKLSWLTLGIAAAVLAAAAWFAATGPAQAAVHAVSMDDVTVAPGDSVTVSLDAVAPATGAGIGAVDITVAYDTAVVEATACTANAAWDVGDCDFATAGSVNLKAADVDGLGDGSLADITFKALGADGTSSALTLTVAIITDRLEVDILPGLVVTNGSISVVAAATPTETPTVEPTATPTAEPTTPAAPQPTTLPTAGGLPSEDGSMGLAMLAAIAGFIALSTLAGGLWIAQRGRRPR